MKTAILLGVAPLLAAHAPDAPERRAPAAGFHFVETSGERGAVRGTIYVPRGLETSDAAPCLVFLHGYGECGTDGVKNLGVGLPQAIVWDAARWSFVVVMPQKPEHNVDWEAYEDAVLAMLDLAVERFGADPGRVGITGLSQGGHGTIALATAHPDRFKAAAPVCGYTSPRFTGGGERIGFETPSSPEHLGRAAGAMAGLGVWIFHGGRDTVVPARESELLHGALVEAGASDVTLTILPEAGHTAWDSAYRESGMWEWFAERLHAGD